MNYEQGLDRKEMVESLRNTSLYNHMTAGERLNDCSNQEITEQELTWKRIIFKTRIILAVFITAAVIYCDKSGKCSTWICPERIFTEISVDYGEVIAQKTAEIIKNCQSL